MRILVAIGIAAFSSLAAAQNWVGLLKGGPAEHFDEEDLRIFMETARKALAESKDNDILRWENPKTQHRGFITVKRTFEWKAYHCRELTVHSDAGGHKGTSSYNLCAVDGKWRLISPSQAAKK